MVFLSCALPLWLEEQRMVPGDFCFSGIRVCGSQQRISSAILLGNESALLPVQPSRRD